MLPLYAARIEDLGSGDFVKVDCAACHHVALLTVAARAPPWRERPRSERAAPVPRVGEEGRAVVSIKWRGQGQ
jgi:hypothetical protein